MAKGYEIEYGGYAVDTKTGKEELLFTTFASEFLCKERTAAEVKSWNDLGAAYDPDSVTVRYRKLETAINPWRNSEEEAELDSAIIRVDECWYTESWNEDDLIYTLAEIGIDSDDPGNIRKALEIVKSEQFQNYFSDCSDQNEFLTAKLTEFFFSKEQVIERIVGYIVKTGSNSPENSRCVARSEELMEKFDVTYKWLSENKDLIKKTLNEREEVLSEPLDINDDDGKWNGFTCNFRGDSSEESVEE